MQNFGGAILATLALMIAVPATAQEAASATLPTKPIPYSKLEPKKAKPRPAAPRPAERAATTKPAASPVAADSTGQPLNPAQIEAFVDGWVADAMAREHVAGAAVSIVQDGRVILKKGYGFADLSPRRAVDPDRTLFRIGPISKTFTWILLMKEVEAGRIRLDRPINLYLPEKVRLPGRGRDLMVRHLLDHSGGFEERTLGQQFEDDPNRVRPLDLYLRHERPEQVRKAGELSSYSSYGAALAGQAVAFVSGKSFEQRVEDEIARPLGMTRTTFREARPERRGLPPAMRRVLWPDLARGYDWRAAGFVPNGYEYMGQAAPAGAASSTASDMSRYMLMLLGNGSWSGVTVFGPRAARAFRTPMQRTPVGINGWAHGFMTYDLPGGHKGYGHQGDSLTFQSNMTLVPDLGLGIFVTTNSKRGARLSENLPSALLRQFYAQPQTFPRPGAAELAAAARSFDGRYLTTRRAHGGLEGFATLLTGGAQVHVTSGGRLITERDGEAKAWAPEGPPEQGRFISAIGDERLAFRLRDGRAQRFQPADNTENPLREPVWTWPTTLASAATLTALAALFTFIGLALRSRRDLRQNQIQARASLVQNIQAGLWIAALTLFGIWAAGSRDSQAVMYGWPGPLLITASASALVAAVLNLITIAALPAVWQGGRRVDSWNMLRKLFFTATVLIYASFSVLLAIIGALEPWSR